MSLKIRCRKQGRKGRPFFRLVVTEAASRRDGRYVEAVGWYDPLQSKEDLNLSLKPDRISYWLSKGATLTEKAESLVRRGAPEVAKELVEKRLAKTAALAKKRREARRRKAAA